MSEDGLLTQEAPAAETTTDTVATEATTETAPASTDDAKFEYVMDKYRAEGRTEQEALEMQAKSYPDLNSKFGSFTGAPEEYELSVSDEMKELGISFDGEDPMVVEGMKYAKEIGMNQEGFNGLLELYAGVNLAGEESAKAQQAEEMKTLGVNAASRTKNINDWASANMSEELLGKLQSGVTSADMVEVVEHFISMTRAAPVNAEAQVASGASKDEVKAMQFELDSHGGRRIQTDPEFRKQYHAKRDQAHGTQDHNVTIGAN